MNIAIYGVNSNSGILERKTIISKASDISYSAKVRDIGSFSFDLPVEASGVEFLKKGFYVSIGNEFDGVIRDVVLKEDSNGCIYTVSGQCLKGLLSQRLIIPPAEENEVNTLGYDAVKGSSEYCIKHYWNANMVNTTSGYRSIPGIDVAINQSRGIKEDKYLARYDVLSDVTTAITADAKLGVSAKIDLEKKMIVFDVFEGRVCTSNQSINPRLIFELERRNIDSLEYTDSFENMKNVFYTTKSGAEFEDEALTLTYYRDEDIPTGIERFEQHLTLSAETPVEGGEYDELKRLAVIEMRNYEATQAITAQISRYNYFEDYFLGDIVTVRSRRGGILADMEITEVQVSYGDASRSVTVTFGDADISSFGRIKRDIKNIKGVF